MFSNSQHIVAAHIGNVTFLVTVSILLYLVYGSLGVQLSYLLVLIRRDSGKHGLRERKGARAFPCGDGPHWG